MFEGVAHTPCSHRYGSVQQDDIWRIAARLIRMFDDGAEMAAAMYADKALARRDLRASIKWKRTVFAIKQMQRASSSHGRVN